MVANLPEISENLLGIYCAPKAWYKGPVVPVLVVENVVGVAVHIVGVVGKEETEVHTLVESVVVARMVVDIVAVVHMFGDVATAQEGAKRAEGR